MTLLMAPTISKAKGHKLLGNQCAMGRAAKLRRIFEFGKAYFTEQLHGFQTVERFRQCLEMSFHIHQFRMATLANLTRSHILKPSRNQQVCERFLVIDYLMTPGRMEMIDDIYCRWRQTEH